MRELEVGLKGEKEMVVQPEDIVWEGNAGKNKLKGS